jgi:GT2 family glycosyltransferase
MKQIHVEIVSPVHNRRELTLQCLRSLSRINQENLKVHIIIVDDGSTDGTSEAISEQFSDVEIIRGDGNLWFTAGSNLGFERALTYNPDYILLINDDTVFDENFLAYLVECAESNPRSAIGGVLLLWDMPHKVFQVAPKFEVWYGGWRHQHQQTVWTIPEKPFEVDFIAGNCILFPADVFRENGLMNARQFPHYADAEFTPRIKKNGWRLLIEPRARIFNQPNATNSLGKMTLRDKYQALWGDLRKQNNLRTRLMVYWIGAPTKLHAVAAWTIYTVRLGLRSFGFNPRWETAEWTGEKPLRDQYSSKT